MPTIEIWVDGAAEPNPGPAAWGIVARRGDGKDDIEMAGKLPITTNNRAELTAILEALTRLTNPGDEVIIHTDSQYCIGVLSWNWKAKKNHDLIKAIWEASRDRDVIYQHISGKDNSRADFLSRLNLT